jgi:hypothetical protein
MTSKQIRVWVANNAGALDRVIAAVVALGLGANGILRASEGPMGPLWLAVGVGLAWAFLSRWLRVPVAPFEGLLPSLLCQGDVIEDARGPANSTRGLLIVQRVSRSHSGCSIDAVDDGGARVSLPIDRIRVRY